MDEFSTMPAIVRPGFEAFRNAKPRLFAGLFIGAFALATLVGTVLGTDPQIARIERYGTNQVTIHFDTAANRTYTLQYSSRVNSGAWSNLFIALAEPGPNHYVVPHAATNAAGFYRLMAAP